MTGTGPGTASVRLTPAAGVDLEEPRLASLLVAAARANAERIGVGVRTAQVEAGGMLLEVEGSMMVALGLAAEVRRATDRWHRERTGRSLWVAPDGNDVP